jgi:uncharacterized protein (TIGR02147 family)
MSKTGGSKSIFEYDDYRAYLRDLYARSKAENSKFSFRYFSRLAGFQSPNFLKRVMDGERNLTLLSIEKFAKALKLNKDESFFFRNLVLLNQSRSTEEKQAYAEQLLKSQTYKKIFPLKESQFKYYNQWYFIPIRELIGLPGFKEDPGWIARKLVPEISPQEAQKAIDELLKMGLVDRDANGRLRLTQTHIKTDDQVISASLAHYHREMAKKAGDSIDLIPREKREISSVTLPVSEKTLKKIKELVKKLQVEIVAAASSEEGPQSVCQINFQIFPLTETVNGEEK